MNHSENNCRICLIIPAIILIISSIVLHYMYMFHRERNVYVLETIIEYKRCCAEKNLINYLNYFYEKDLIFNGFRDIGIMENNEVIIKAKYEDGKIIPWILDNHDWKYIVIQGKLLKIRYTYLDYSIKVIIPVLIMNFLLYLLVTMMVKNDRKRKDEYFIAQEKARFKTFSTITGGIAHNFRNNFHVIQGQLRLIKKDILYCKNLHEKDRMRAFYMLEEKDKGIDKQIEKLKVNLDTCQALRNDGIVRRITKIEPVIEEMCEEISSMLEFIKVDRTMEVINVQEVVQFSTELFTNSVENKQVIVKTIIDPIEEQDSYVAIGRKQSLMTVVLNILNNSVKAKNKEFLHIKVHLWHDKKTINILCEDDGKGMDEETKARAFDPFFTTDKAKGTGLGLSTAKAIIERMDGTISINTELGIGTEILIQLPKGTK